MDYGLWTIRVERTQLLLASRATMASTLWTRMAGLLGRRALPDGEALVFERCRAVHTVGMRFPIDVVFVDRGWRVVAVRHAVGPGRVLGPVWGAWGVIEMASGSLARAGLKVGEQLTLAEVH